MPSNSRIAVVAPPYIKIPNDGYGGIEKVAIQRYLTLADKGFKPHLFGNVDESSGLESTVIKQLTQKNSFKKNNILSKFLKNSSILYSTRYLSIKNDHNYRIVINEAFRAEPWIAISFAIKFGASRMLNILHGPGFSFENIYSRIEWPILSRLNFGALNTETNEFLRRKGVNAHYFPNGITVPDDDVLASKGYLIFIGRIDRVKKPHIAISVAKALDKDLILVGPISDYNYYQREIEPMLDTQIKYLGQVPSERMKNLIKESEALCYVASNNDPQPAVILEANSFGVPVISIGDSRFNGVNDMLLPNVNGVKVSFPEDVESRFSALLSINRNRVKRHVYENWRWEIVYDRYWNSALDFLLSLS